MSDAPPLRLAIAQVAMAWTPSENLAAMRWAVAQAHADGARLVLFAELAIPGFHRRIVEWATPEVMAPAVETVCGWAREFGIALAAGAPTFGDDGTRFNSHLLIDEHGRVAATVAKRGLTAPEATFFAPGRARPVATLAGVRTSAVICREIEDLEAVRADFAAEAPALVVWPGQMRPDPTQPPVDPPQHIADAQRLARALGCWVVQTNWPNALNRPDESAHTGASACIAPDGALRFRLPEQGRGVAVFDLGQTGYNWHAQPHTETAAA